jgi:fibronectin type 3 domain-containing protein
MITSINATTFIDSGLVPGDYSYQVAAYDVAGNVSMQSTPVNVMLIQDTVPPSVPTNLSVSPTSTYNSTSSAQVTLSWSASTDNVGVAGYYVYRDGAKITTSTAPLTATSYIDTVPPGAWTYSYKVVAYDVSGNISPYSSSTSVVVISDMTPPSQPTRLTAKQTGLLQVSLSWTGATDNIGVTGYDIYRNGSLVGTSATTSYVDTGATAGVAYAYAVAAYDASGNVSEWSPSVTLAVSDDNAPPSIPSNILGTVGSTSVALSWNPSNDVIGVAGYTIFRNSSQIATVATTSYLDTAPVTGSNLYSISSYNMSGISSSPSAAVNIVWYLGASTTAAVTPSPSVISVPVVVAPAVASSTIVAPSISVVSGSPVFTDSMYYGLRSNQISTLQSFLIAHNYLTSSATGFFGTLTLQAVKQFQCDQNIACTGSAGWGLVGAKTRSVLNSMANTTSTVSSSSSIAALTAELQALETQLRALQAQVQ